jgi:ADP-ribose pyrophosphatase
MSDENIQSEIVFRGRVFNVRIDHISLAGRRTARIDVVEHNGAVTILPIDEGDLVWFIRQYRHPVGRELLELPAGVMEDSEAPEYSAQRELREEIGMAADKLKLLGKFFLAPGYSTEQMFAFLATDLRLAPLMPDEGEEISIEKIPIGEVLSVVSEGRIQDSKTLAVLFLWFSLEQKIHI